MDSPMRLKSSLDRARSGSNTEEKDKLSGGHSSIQTSIFNLSKTIVGNGILSLPFAVSVFAESPKAMFVSCGIVSVMGYLAAYTFANIGKICLRYETDSFAIAWMRCTESSTGGYIAALITANTFLSCLASAIIIGDAGASLCKANGIEQLSTRSPVIVSCFGFVLLPLCLLKRMDALKYTSLLGIIGSIFCCVFIAWRYFDGSYATGGLYFRRLPITFRPKFGESINYDVRMFQLLTTTSSSYQAHYNAPRIWSELQAPTIPRFHTVVNFSFLFAVIINCCVMALGFFTFGQSTASLILNNYATSDPGALLARGAIWVGTMLGFPLSFYALRDGVSDIFGISDKQSSFSTSTLLVLIMSCALVLRNVSSVISFSGALFGTCLIYILPSYMMILTLMRDSQRISQAHGSGNHDNRMKSWKFDIFLNCIVLLIGIIIAVIGVSTSIKKLLAG